MEKKRDSGIDKVLGTVIFKGKEMRKIQQRRWRRSGQRGRRKRRVCEIPEMKGVKCCISPFFKNISPLFFYFNLLHLMGGILSNVC